MARATKTTPPEKLKRHWAEHPAVVSGLAIAGAVTLIAFGMGLQALLSSAENSTQTDEPEETRSPAAPAESTSATGLSDADVSTKPLSSTTVAAATTEPSSTSSDEDLGSSSTSTAEVRLPELPASAVPITEVIWRSDEDGLFQELPEAGSIGLVQHEEILWCRSATDFNGFGSGGGVELRVDRNYSTFVALVGADDDNSSSSTTDVVIYDQDGEDLLPRQSFKLGDSRYIEIDITDSIRVHIECTSGAPRDTWVQVGFVGAAVIPK